MKLTKYILAALSISILAGAALPALTQAHAQRDYDREARKKAREERDKVRDMSRKIREETVHVPIKVSIDCYHSSLSNEGTNDWITVNFFRGNKHLKSKTKKKGITCSATGADTDFIINNTDFFFDRFEIATSGTNAFYIDELRISKQVKRNISNDIDLGSYKEWREIKHFGRDNGKGWCVSRDHNDSNGSWKNYIDRIGCQTVHNFTVHSWYDQKYDRPL